MNWNRKEKNKIRKIQTKKLFLASTALGLPGSQLKCVKQSLDQGTINKDTFYIAVEKDGQIASTIDKKLSKMGFTNYYVHDGNLYTLKLSNLLRGRQLDFTFLDFCGELTPKTALWLYRCSLMNVFNSPSVLSITFCSKIRRGKFIQTYMKSCNSMPNIVLQKIYSDNCNCNFLNNWIDPNDIIKNRRFNTSIGTISALVSSLVHYDINITDVLHYCDKTQMFGLRSIVLNHQRRLNQQKIQLLKTFKNAIALYNNVISKSKKISFPKALSPYDF